MIAQRLLAVAALAVAAPALADTVQLPSSKDNTIYQNQGTTSNGAGSHMFAGRTGSVNPIRRALVAFDVSAIPAGSTVDSVVLQLRMSKTPLSTARAIALHRALADWGEGASDADTDTGGGTGGGAGAPAQAGDATWTNRFHPGSPWVTAGGDFDPVESFSRTVGAPGLYTFGTAAGLVADVQEWLDIPGSNFGWFLIGNEATNFTVKRFETHEALLEADRPLLTVHYTPPPVSVGGRAAPGGLVELLPVAPNPSTHGIVLHYRLAEAGRVRVGVHDARGRMVAALVDAELPAGEHSVAWGALGAGGTRVASGVYWARVELGGASATRSFVIAR
jgi:hypothetical protein